MILLLALLVAGPAAAQTIKDVLLETYLSNPQLAAGRARLRATDELVPQALSGWRPRVSLEGTYESVRGQGTLNQTEQGVDVDRSTTRAAAVVRQNLYNGGGTVAATSRAENLVRAERASLLALEQATLLNAIEAYTAVFRERAVYDLALINEERLKRQLQATRDRFNVGEVARTDVAQAEARLSRARADVEAATATLTSSTAFYRRVVGREPGKLARPERLKELPRTFADAEAIATTNPEIILASFNLAASQDDIDVSYADLLPDVDLTARAEHATEPQIATQSQRSATLGLALVIPLYQGGAEYSRVRQSRQTMQQRRNDLEARYRSVQETVTAAWEDVRSTAAAIVALRSEVRANDIALRGVQEENLVGARTVLDVLDAEQALFTSRVDLVRAERAEVLASYRLKAAIGELLADRIGLPVEPYDATANYRQVRDRLFGIASMNPGEPRRR